MARIRPHVPTTALIGVAHGCSHFFQLVVPPLFPFLVADFAVSYTELGALMTTFFVTSGLGQPVAGFLVDRFGARRVILLGLGGYAGAVFALSLLPSIWMFYPVMILAALGNCVFHPSDFTVLNANVRVEFLGRAFGIHTLGGNLGWALAPVFMLGVAGVAGWRAALMAAAALGAAVWLLLWWNRDRLGARAAPRGAEHAAPSLGAEVLLSPPVLLCFLYFLLLAAALIAVQNFLPPILAGLHATPLVLAGTALSGFLVGASAGVLCGGIWADRTSRHTGIIVGGLLGSGLLVLVVAEVDLHAVLLVAAVAGAGFLSGLTTPSRDLLVRSATPPGTTGRVFGFVYSGLDAGSALAPVSVGLMLDYGEPRWALWAVATMMLAAILTAVSIRGALPAPAPATGD